ncbi:hypothetical protein [Levilactobacillus acidifarinae]|uniref:Uncharacterized protein n=1 Tax=Levilactobacillus acidifarinae DSM 19394 = JCM 15949 TaxID=1423715 RepID=A0A0R1LGV3_9LACO|nr:hypothetical protein [Levilactobacillus acidifarinae]KRK94696.1 hypothetical protein FD25_GL000668 [Levilactobacillus acidifarinae DSM 19394]GEO68450.1 hypothetical protein LAC03_03600 [Levilactobacillus acidifarinae]
MTLDKWPIDPALIDDDLDNILDFEARLLCIFGSPLTDQEIATAAQIPVAIITAIRQQEVDYRDMKLTDALALDEVYELAQEAYDEPPAH